LREQLKELITDQNRSKTYVGIDPGAKCMYGIIKKKSDDFIDDLKIHNKNEEKQLYRTRQYFHQTKYYQRKIKYQKLTKDVFTKIQKERQYFEEVEDICIARKNPNHYKKLRRFYIKTF